MQSEISTGQTAGVARFSTNIHDATRGDGVDRVGPNLLVAGFVVLTAAWTIVMAAFAWWAVHH